MVKINDTTTFPNTAPALGDHFPGTDVSNTGTDAAGETVTFTLQAVMDLFEANMTVPASVSASYQLQPSEGSFVDGDKTKLDGIEASADVTDAANVETAIEAITLTAVSGATGDEVLIVDATDGGLKAVLWENLPGSGGGISNVVEDTTPQLGGMLDVNGQSIGDGTLELLKFSETLSAVNEVTVTNAATGNAPSLSATGDDTNISLNLISKGTGVVQANGSEVLTAASGTTLSAATSAGADSVPFFDATDSDNPKITTITNLIADNSIALTSGNLSQFAATTSAQLAGVISDETGSGALVFGTNPTLATPTINDPRIAHEYNAQTGTTYTLVAADQSAVITMSNASANTLTIPPNSSVAFPVGTIVTVFQLGAGATTVEGGTGVTVNGVSTGGAAIQNQYGAATIVKIATDTWIMQGDIGAVA